MMNKRKYERYEIGLPARIKTISDNKKQVFDLVTKNISASGAFLDTTSPFSEGLRIKMSLTTNSERIVELTGSQCLIECEGSVVRITPTGIGICFNKECQIMSLKNF